MCFPKNFLRQPFLQNANRLLHSKYLLIIKTAALNKFSEAAICRYLSKQTRTQMFSCKYCKISMNSLFYRTPLMAASEKYEYTVYMLNLLKDCYNCFLFSLIEKHLNEPIIYYNFSFLIEKRFSNFSSLLWLAYKSLLSRFFSVNKLYYVILQFFFCIQLFPRSRFFWVQFFQGRFPWSGSRFQKQPNFSVYIF